MKFNSKNYYKIDEKITALGIFELWENNVFGDEWPSVVTLNNVYLAETYDSLDEYIQDYMS